MDSNAFLEQALLDKKLVAPEKINGVKQLVTPEKGLAEILIDQNMVKEDVILELLSEFFGLTAVNVNHYAPESEVIALVPLALCQKFNVLPLFKIKNTLMVATANPSDVHALDEIRVKVGFGIEPVLALSRSIQNAISKHYSIEDSMTDMMDSMKHEEEVDIGLAGEEKELVEAASDEPVVKLVNLIFSQAVRERASDIHINPDAKMVRVRYRIDGILHEAAQPPKKLQAALTSRIKILANLDIAERRKPQDGRIELKVENRSIDLRVSTLPTIYGENVVMRILDKGNVLIGLTDLGFAERDLTLFNKLIQRPHGIILTSGPTGSGKTTTLYAALNTLNSIDTNIITLEDPVEYNLQLIRQSQINPKADFTFASGLRAILRQDPDVILVGEIRDYETASIAVQAAMTGHLVLSTLHTNDAPGCVIRLTEMGIQHFLISSTMIAALAQRLVRLICESCKEAYEPPKELLEDLEPADRTGYTFYHGRGCQECRNTGYRRRIGLYELMEITPRMQDAIVHKKPETELRAIAREEGMRTLREDGIEKVKKGLTTIEEVLRATKTG